MKVKLTITEVSDGDNTHTEATITSPELNSALRYASKAARHLMWCLIKACEDLTRQH